jgi:peptide/nickel transport system substrate-binding protein
MDRELHVFPASVQVSRGERVGGRLDFWTPFPYGLAMTMHIVLRSLALCVAVLSAFGSSPASAAEGELRIGLHVTLATKWLDPAETEAFQTPFMVLYAVHDALVKPMPAGPTTPSLAESWAEAKDHLSYTFTLRRNAKFHNGDPVTAEDVKFSFERYKGASATLLKGKVKEVVAPSPNQVRFVLKEPWPDFMTFYGTTASGAGWVVPKKYVEKVGEDGFKNAPVGAGPYKFVSTKPGVEMVLEAFDGYWRKAPSVKRIVMRSMTEETTRTAALHAGEIDIAYLLTGPAAEKVRSAKGFALKAPLLSGAFWLELPDQWDPKSPWADKRVRQAANHAVDRQSINQAETLGFSRLTGSMVPRIFQFALTYEPEAYDPARARKLLAEAGYPNGFDGGELHPFPPYNSMGEAIVGNLQSVGIRTKMRIMERAAYFAAWRDRKLHGVILVITAASGNAATRLEPYVTKGGIYAYGSLPQIDDLYVRQSRELDGKKREEMVHQIQKLMHEHVMHVPIYELAFIWGVGPRVGESTAGAVAGYPYTAPMEDLTLKK